MLVVKKYAIKVCILYNFLLIIYFIWRIVGIKQELELTRATFSSKKIEHKQDELVKIPNLLKLIQGKKFRFSSSSCLCSIFFLFSFATNLLVTLYRLLSSFKNAFEKSDCHMN